MTDDIRPRLEQCFLAVFPDLAPEEVPRASPATVAAWDSLANVTLVSVVENEFNIQIPFDDPDWTASFEVMMSHLEEMLNGG